MRRASLSSFLTFHLSRHHSLGGHHSPFFSAILTLWVGLNALHCSLTATGGQQSSRKVETQSPLPKLKQNPIILLDCNESIPLRTFCHVGSREEAQYLTALWNVQPALDTEAQVIIFGK